MRQVNLHIEGVPNPNSIKFVLENGVLTQEAFEFRSFAETGYSPLARKLMMLRYMERVLFHRNYITLSKNPQSSVEWDSVLPELREIIVNHLANNEPILYLGFKPQTHVDTQDEFQKMIHQLMDKYIRPAAQEDGGDILVESFENDILKLNLVGSCKTCPYIQQTIKNGLEPIIREHIPGVSKIVW